MRNTVINKTLKIKIIDCDKSKDDGRVGQVIGVWEWKGLSWRLARKAFLRG